MRLARAQELLGFVGLSKEKFDLPAKNLNVVELASYPACQSVGNKSETASAG